jgi:nitrate reductase assembly molybdenum cofactor insertion protein NarJ
MTEISAITDPRLRQLLSDATAWRLLGLLFERPREGWWQEVEALGRSVSDPEIRAAADAAREEASEGLYLAVLGPGGPVSPREVTYRGMEDPGRIVADISAFYEAFAFRPETEEAPDHLAVEAGFVGYLRLKEAYAWARGNEEEAEVAAKAATRFLETHLSTLAWPVAERIATADLRYLTLSASALARLSGPRPEAATVKAPLPLCEDCPMECGQE